MGLLLLPFSVYQQAQLNFKQFPQVDTLSLAFLSRIEPCCRRRRIPLKNVLDIDLRAANGTVESAKKFRIRLSFV